MREAQGLRGPGRVKPALGQVHPPLLQGRPGCCRYRIPGLPRHAETSVGWAILARQ